MVNVLSVVVGCVSSLSISVILLKNFVLLVSNVMINLGVRLIFFIYCLVFLRL